MVNILLTNDDGVAAPGLWTAARRPATFLPSIHHGKGDKKRVIFLGEAARSAAWKYLDTRKKAAADEYLFLTPSPRRMLG